MTPSTKCSTVTKDGLCQRVGEWFLNSGIQETDGGVARYYLSDLERNAPLSTEITGYCASSLMTLYECSRETRYLYAAVNAAVYLIKSWDTECLAMPFEAGSAGRKYSYFFDDGIIARALLAVWRTCGNPEFLSTAQLCADSMACDFFDGQEFSPILELPAKSALPYESARWSRSPGCYQLKAGLAWHELWQITKDEHYLALYRRLLNICLSSHKSFLPGIDTELQVMDRLHAYLYFLEGLLPTIDESASANAIADGIARVAGFVKQLSSQFLRSDVLAQLLRVRLFADHGGIRPLDVGAAEKEIAILRDFQSEDSDTRLNGGFWFGMNGGEMLPFMNPVSTAFCHQALEMWNKKDCPLRWQSLI